MSLFGSLTGNFYGDIIGNHMNAINMKMRSMNRLMNSFMPNPYVWKVEKNKVKKTTQKPLQIQKNVSKEKKKNSEKCKIHNHKKITFEDP